MKLIMKRIFIISLIICMLFPMLFSNVSIAAKDLPTTTRRGLSLTTERAGNYAATFAINFFQNWSSVNYYNEERTNGSNNASNGSFVWPLEVIDVSSEYGPRSIDNHKGMDFSAGIGTNVYSSTDGTVIDVYTVCTHNYGKVDTNGNVYSCYNQNGQRCGGGYGNHIRIDCGNDIIVLYGHLTDVKVNIGDRVTQGQIIGTVGSTGMSSRSTFAF